MLLTIYIFIVSQDVSRYWIYLTVSLRRAISGTVPSDIAGHLLFAFNKRSMEIPTPICLLALFLDPRYRLTVDTKNKAVLKHLTLIAAKIALERGATTAQLNDLCNQLKAYASDAPSVFANSGNVDQADFCVKAWWEKLPTASANVQLRSLAVLLFSIPPHAAGPERTFSLFDWVNAKRRNRLHADKTAKITTIKMYFDNKKAAAVRASESVGESKKRKAPATPRETIASPTADSVSQMTDLGNLSRGNSMSQMSTASRANRETEQAVVLEGVNDPDDDIDSDYGSEEDDEEEEEDKQSTNDKELDELLEEAYAWDMSNADANVAESIEQSASVPAEVSALKEFVEDQFGFMCINGINYDDVFEIAGGLKAPATVLSSSTIIGVTSRASNEQEMRALVDEHCG